MFAPPFVWLQKRPAVPELEFSGEIAGGDLTGTDFAIGDECFGITVFPFVRMPPNPPSQSDSFSASESLKTGHGALGEYTITDSTRLLRKPATLSHIDAAALPVATILPYWSMVNFGGLKLAGDQRVFVVRLTIRPCGATGLTLRHHRMVGLARRERVRSRCALR